MANGQKVGYIRVSTVEQNTERQLDGIKLDRIFTDKASGKDAKRPQLQAALEYLRVTRSTSTASIVWRVTRKTCCESSAS